MDQHWYQDVRVLQVRGSASTILMWNCDRIPEFPVRSDWIRLNREIETVSTRRFAISTPCSATLLHSFVYHLDKFHNTILNASYVNGKW